MPAHSPAVDFHAHFVPDFYRDAATRAGYGDPDGIAGFPPWSVNEALGMMDRNGITVAVASVSSPGVHFGDDAAARQLARRVNEFNAAVSGKHPDRFAVLASLPLPDIEGALAEITYAFDVLHVDGVTLETAKRSVP
jgi:6-methylsalicylate decarboxylase